MKKKLILIGCLILVFSFSVAPFVHALPWLDIGDNLLWDENNNVLFDGGLAWVTSITYLDHTTVPPPFFPPPDPILYSNVRLYLTFNDDPTDDVFRIRQWSGGGWVNVLTADPVIVRKNINPLAGKPPYYNVFLDNIWIDPSLLASSKWAQEFNYVISHITNTYPAVLNITWGGGSFEFPPGSGVYKINASVKLVPTPEPGTILLLGSGMMGVAYYVRWRRKK
jgi:hypothetical protein